MRWPGIRSSAEVKSSIIVMETLLAPHYGGAALEGWKRIGRWPDASDLAWAETSGKARVRCGDPTADKSRRTLVSNRRAGRQDTGIL